MAVSLNTYLNNKIKSKGSTLSKEKAKASKYKSISAAKKAGALYYTDKNGKVMAAVYAEDLKKAAPKSAAPKKSLRPKARPSASSTSAATAAETAEVAAANKKIKASEAARKNVGPNADRKRPMKKLKGADWMAANTSAAYHALTKSEARNLNLPATRLAAMQSPLRKNTFSDGQGWDYKVPSKSKSKGPDPSKLANPKK